MPIDGRYVHQHSSGRLDKDHSGLGQRSDRRIELLRLPDDLAPHVVQLLPIG